MADSLVPADDLPESPSLGGEVPESDLPGAPEPDQGETSTVGASLEGVAKGVAGPLATAAELGLSKLGVPNLTAEDQAARETQHPYAEGVWQAVGLVGGALIPGLGEYSLGAKIAEGANAAAKAAEFGKVGSVALKGAIEAGLFQASDEGSKYLLGESDPEAPVSSALAHIGGAALLGSAGGVLLGAAGSKLQSLAEGKTASKASQFLADLGNRFDFLTKNKDIPGAATEEASNLFDAVNTAGSGGYALKRDAVDALTKDIDPDALSSYVNKTFGDLTNAPKGIQEGSLYRDAVNEWKDKVFPKTDIVGGQSYTPAASDVFEATDQLKRQLQEWGRYNKQLVPLSEQPFRNAAKSIGFDLRNSLEDESAWGKMGTFQKSLNQAFSELQTPQKEFLQSFGTKVNGEYQIDPIKIASTLRQSARTPGALRGERLAGFIEPAQKLLKTVDDLHTSMGLESHLPTVSTNVLDEMLSGKASSGAKMADWLFGTGPKSIGMVGAHVAGTVAGAAVGHPYLGYRAGEALQPILEDGLGRKITRGAVGGVLKALAAGSPEAVPQAMHYAESIGKGAEKINSAVDNVFTIGGQKLLNHDFSNTARESLKNYVAKGQLNQEIENQKNQGNVQAQASGKPVQGFAHGGEVLAPEPAQPVEKPVAPVLKGTKHIATVFPEQAMLLGAAKGRINTYLNSIRPQAAQSKLPFDEERPDKQKERAYNKALDMANKPLSVLDHVKNGTLTAEHMQHMQGMYPELTNHLQKKLMEKTVAAQTKNERPPYKVRQSLSLFMGAAMDSTLTPQNIMAAQGVFANQASAPPNAPVTKNKRNTSDLGKVPGQYRTAEQAAASRQSSTKV